MQPTIVGSTTTTYYLAGSNHVAVRTGTSVSYLLSDQLGSTSITADGNGNKISELRYKAWGEVRYTSGTTATKYTYTGQYSNMADFGLMFYNARWYDPTIGRFVQPDTIIPSLARPQSWDRYSYVLNNPILFNDPSGHLIACNDDVFTHGCSSNRLSVSEELKKNIGRDFGVTMFDSKKNWDIRNLAIIYGGLSTMNYTVGGRLKDLVGGAVISLDANSMAGHYSGFTNQNRTTFYTSTSIPMQNLYHELGHLLDNMVGSSNAFSKSVGAQAVYSADGRYLFGGSGTGTISATTLTSTKLSDPVWPNGSIDALQHPSSDPVEQWADIWANYVSNNINGQPDGIAMQQAVQQAFATGVGTP